MLVALTLFWPLAPSWSAPAASPAVTNLGLLATGGTASASSSLTLGPDQAFDGVFFAETKASTYENGWVARSGAGAWLERRWPGQVEVTGLTMTRRSNRTIGLCDKAREVSVDLGGGQPKLVTLADTNAPQYFPLAINSTRSVRLTVQSVEGTGCTGGNVGLAEVEIYGLPKNWTPTTVTTAPAVIPTAVIPANQLQFTYDANIPADSQAYLTTLTNKLRPVMTEVLGPPLTGQTLLIRLDPSYGSFTYAAGLSTLTISRLPNASWPPTDPANWDFNSNLTHELAHAYQSGYGFGAPAWFREGFAQSATELIKQVFNERNTPMLQNATIDEGQAIRTYDSLAAMGPEMMEAAWNGNSRIIPYTNASGFWWLLILSQSSPRLNGTYAELDWLRRVETGLYQFAPDNSYAARRNFLASVSPNLIDGQPVSQWLMRQSIVQSAAYRSALGFYPGDCFCSQNATAEAQHLIIFSRGSFNSVSNMPVRVALRDATGTVVSDQTVTYIDYGFGYFYYTFPILIDRLPTGRYDITVEATVDGAPLRATQSIVRGGYSLDAASGLSVTQRLASALSPLSVSSPLGIYQADSFTGGRLTNLPLTPLDLELTVNNRPVTEKIFWPAPYTRYINLP